MNGQAIIDNLEKLINEETEEFCSAEEESGQNAVDAFMRNTALRLANTYSQYRVGECAESDYLASLRNFMLVFQTALRFEKADIPEDNAFGIYKLDEEFKYYAAYDIPAFIKRRDFVEKAFINNSTPMADTDSKYLLQANEYIRRLTGYETFKSIEQKLCVYGALNAPAGYTVLISMPTGGGKSLITQAVGYETKGLSIVVVPTVSLAIDQERAARKNIRNIGEGEIFCYYSGVKNTNKILEAIEKRTLRLLFISPEALLKNEQFKQLIRQANRDRYIKNLIIDEAHIAVAWGDYFRVDYQCLGPWRNELLKANPDIRTFLLSATFRDETVTVLKKLFSDAGRWMEIRCDSLRKEPHFILQMARDYHDKRQKVLELVNKLPRPMILYVDAPYAAKQWKDFLERHGYENVRTYTGETESGERRALIEQWAENQFEVMIATSAFGVGVDKPDVRSVLHLYIPPSPDAYYQELGRGGRDGLPCLSVMCIEKGDIINNKSAKVLTTEKLWGRWWSMYRDPANQWQNGLIAVLASTKPSYNRTHFFESGNSADEKWNIYVLLLLNRYAQIKIMNIDLDQQNRYLFTIQVLNDQIIVESDETQRLFEQIREAEAVRIQKSFDVMKDSIEKSDVSCWSSMFYDTYPLVSEYCAGCNCHGNQVTDALQEFPLLKDVERAEKVVSKKVKELFSTTRELLILTKSDRKEVISEYLPNVVVCKSGKDIGNVPDPRLIYMNFAEYSALQEHDRGFYIVGLVMVIYSDNEEEATVEYKGIVRYLTDYRYIVHVSGTDFCVERESGKKISEKIDGAVVRR